MTTLITNKNFIDWESYVFGYGYGTGENYTIEILRSFFELCDENYDYQKLEEKLGGPTTWLLINTLCHADIINYGSSPRYGFLTQAGVMLKNYMLSKTFNELYELTSIDTDTSCFPNLCQCNEEPKKEPCNPLFKRENL